MTSMLRTADRRILRLGAVLLAIGWLATSIPVRVLAMAVDTPVVYSIPGGDLGSALNAIAIQGNLQIFFEESTVTGLTAPPVEGSMSAKDALALVLADKSLEFVQNADDTILVRPKAAAADAKSRPHRKARSAPGAPLAVVTQATPAMITVPGTEGRWLFRARGLYADPRNRSDPAVVAPGISFPADGITTNGRWYPELDVEYFWNSHWSTELAVSIPQRQDLVLSSASTFNRVRAGSFKQGLNDLTMKYNFAPNSAVRPYLGVGINVTSFSHDAAAPFGLNAGSVGPVVQTGADLRLGSAWFLNADVKWAKVRANLHFNDNPAGPMQVDPVRFGLGIGYRFGGTPARQVAAPVPPVVDSDGDGIPDGADQCPATPHGVTVDVRGCPLDSDSDQVPDYRDQCPGTPASVSVDANGCPLDTDHDGVADYLDRCPGTPAGLKVDANGCEVEELILKGVTFQTGSATLTAESTQTLDTVVSILRQRPNARIEVHGYTDSVGSDALNLRLSERRARSVVGYFAKSGIAPAMMTSRGFGKADPVETNATAVGRAANRRVTVRFQSPVPR